MIQQLKVVGLGEDVSRQIQESLGWEPSKDGSIMGEAN